MKRSTSESSDAAIVTPTHPPIEAKSNGHTNGELASAELTLILASLQTMRRDGDFSVRLPGAPGPASLAKSRTRSTRSSPPISRWRRN